MEGTGRTSGFQKEKETQGKRGAFSALIWRKRIALEQSYEVRGRAWATDLRYRLVAKDVWQGLGGTSH